MTSKTQLYVYYKWSFPLKYNLNHSLQTNKTTSKSTKELNQHLSDTTEMQHYKISQSSICFEGD